MAWFTTKTPSPYRNNWAVAGSLLTLVFAGISLWGHHADIYDARRGLIGLAIALAGLYVFGQGGSPAKSEAPADGVLPSHAAPALAQPTGSMQPAAAFIPPSERKPARAYRIPAEGSASSIALANAAEDPSDPNQTRWDPISFIRSATPPEKSRA
jgi:hypothetical protein